MKNQTFLFNRAAVSIMLLLCLFITSCDTINGPDLQDKDGIKKVKGAVIKAFGADKKLFSLGLYARDHMNSDFFMAAVSFLENGKSMDQILYAYPREAIKPAKESPIQNAFILKDRQGSVALKDLNFDQIPAKAKEAETLIPKEYKDFHLHSWIFHINNNNKITADFTLEAGKKGEGSKLQGRRIVSSYYEMNFTMDENGKITLKDE
ncbi:hypothetical protein A8C56_04320 [Niabella ginsenosidivorans]|uniref:Lipoprotein n=1 Tax=Niabella ginsenosidivorans TaxID=1176587 RepID=A0A1A9HYZ4_9BACT|nr:hypothetical protein [Niabella ginsenosidivorans]ANH80305.1 hypothetical protein A8C56_04320 [Niabella ginsenosidivorans]